MTEKIWNLTIEILCLLTGQMIPPVTYGDHVTIMVPPPPSTTREKNNMKKILEVTHRMTDLLTGEVPIRCQDVAIFLSVEEWEYLEGHKGLYKNAIMEDLPFALPPGGSDRRSLPEAPLYPRYSSGPTQLDQSRHGQVQNRNELIVQVKEEEGEEMSYLEHKDATVRDCPLPPSSDGRYASRRSEKRLLLSPDEGIRDRDITADAPESSRMRNLEPYIADLSPAIDMERLPDGSPPVRYPEMCSRSKCDKCFSHKPAFYRRGRPCAGERPYSSGCDKCLSCKPALLRREGVPTGEEPHPCSERKKSARLRREGVHTGEEPHPCSERKKSALLRHVGEEQTSCSKCGKGFSCQAAQIGEEPNSCSECVKCFSYRSDLVRHEGAPMDEEPNCSECGKSFSCQPAPPRHETVQIGEEPNSCSECGECFSCKAASFRQGRVRPGEKPHSCSDRRSDVTPHESHHAGEKAYSRSDCGKRSVDPVRRSRAHTGKKSYFCSKCGSVFPSKSALLTHERVHSGERPYACSECGKRFSYKSTLMTHERLHTGEKPYPCSECGKRFAHKSDLTKHYRVHTGEKPFVCSNCGKCFSSKSNFLKHERAHLWKNP